MSQETYDYENDVYANREMQKDWGKLFLDNQTLSKETPYVYRFRKEKKDYSNLTQLKAGFGLYNPLFWVSTLGLTYYGGMVFAKKQHINSPTYFRNHAFDFLGARRHLFLGMVAGAFLGSLIVGKPYLIEDVIRTNINYFFTHQRVDRGFDRTLISACDGFNEKSRTEIKTIFDNDA